MNIEKSDSERNFFMKEVLMITKTLNGGISL